MRSRTTGMQDIDGERERRRYLAAVFCERNACAIKGAKCSHKGGVICNNYVGIRSKKAPEARKTVLQGSVPTSYAAAYGSLPAKASEGSL